MVMQVDGVPSGKSGLRLSVQLCLELRYPPHLLPSDRTSSTSRATLQCIELLAGQTSWLLPNVPYPFPSFGFAIPLFLRPTVLAEYLVHKAPDVIVGYLASIRHHRGEG